MVGDRSCPATDVEQVLEETIKGQSDLIAQVLMVGDNRPFIGALIVLPNEWTAGSEELAPTMRLKRPVIHTKYSDTIESLYGGG